MKQFLLTLLLLISFHLNAQENVCSCCSYASLQYQQDYEKIFNPSLIKYKGIKEVMVYNKVNDSIGSNKYREIKFRFNRNGLVKSKTWYNRMGKPHSIYDLKRNRHGKIYQQIFNYLDNLEQKSTFFGQEIIDFKYDSKQRLIKVKERNYKEEVIDDNKTKYTIFEYDDRDRIIKRENHRNYQNESSISTTTYTFSDSSYSCTYETMRNGVLGLSGNTKYNKNWQLILDKNYNERTQNAAFEEHYEYDQLNRLIRYESIAGDGAGSECPDGGNFVDIYKYDKDGLLVGIIHKFRKNICKMTFDYQKWQ